MLAIAETDLREAYQDHRKAGRYKAVDAAKAQVMSVLAPEGGEAKYDKEQLKTVFKELQAKIVRWEHPRYQEPH